jgi:hypothetical protein
MGVRRRLVAGLAATMTMALVGTGVRGQTTLYENQGTQLQKSNKMWEQSDNCGKESFQKYPDYTADGAAKRDAYMRACLRRHHLPPRNDLAQPLKPGS